MEKMKKPQLKLLAVGIVTLIVAAGLIVLFFENHESRAGPINVACIGDSITEWSKYPETLQTMLGANYTVGNFGVAGSTVLLNSNKPYMKQSAFQEAKAFQPSIVIIMLGTNDAKANTYQSIENFADDYTKLISEYQALANKPQIWIVKPPPIFENELGLDDTNLEEGVIPRIEQVANDLSLPTIDVNLALANHSEYFGDGVHPSLEGAELIASEIKDAITFASAPD